MSLSSVAALLVLACTALGSGGLVCAAYVRDPAFRSLVRALAAWSYLIAGVFALLLLSTPCR